MLMLSRFWDAVNDPLFGVLSDHTRSRWGRRRPYLLFGAVPFGVFFALLWFIPQTQNQMLLFAYYTIAYILYEGAATAIGCPYNALMPELTLDHDERTSLVTYRMAVSIGAGLAALVLVVQVVVKILQVAPIEADDRPELLQRVSKLFAGFVLGVACVLDAVDHDLAFLEGWISHVSSPPAP